MVVVVAAVEIVVVVVVAVVAVVTASELAVIENDPLPKAISIRAHIDR